MIRSNLKSIIDSRNISVRQLAREIDYRFESVRQMYNDEMERYPRELLSRLCRHLNVSINELLSDDRD